MSVKVAVASDDGETVGWGHFAHNRYFLIYEVNKGSFRLLEKRFNPFSSVPDIDDPGAIHTDDDPDSGLARLHGIEKYSTLRKMALSDVELIIASGGCPTSIVYFTGEGVRFIFTEPSTDASKVLEELANKPVDELPAIMTFEDGKLVLEF
ncbi:MAG: NifB/NifX family molybdenum-iron cluster-binding protein [Desulfurococcales archaeon]|nr:NifB/NifX family molybdenum-iron cluster-binding protein [Desulfurococcales archaeon]